jgi:hypothetical protein
MRALCLSILIALLTACGGVGGSGVNDTQIAESLKATKERANPPQYLLVSSKWKENLIGRKVFDGAVKNSAQQTTFEQIQITFHFYDSLNTHIGARTFQCVESLAPGKTYIFKIKTFAPVPTKTYLCSVKAKAQRW